MADVQEGSGPSTPASHDSSVGNPRRWPGFASLLTAWIVPATTAQRTNHVSLGRALLLHWVSLWVLTPPILAVGVRVGCSRCNTWHLMLDRTASRIAGALRGIPDDPFMGLLSIAAVFAGIEIGFLALALLAAPWGARDEPMLASIRAALRRTWIQTSQVPVVILLFGLCRGNARELAPVIGIGYRTIIVDDTLALFTWFMWCTFRSVGADRETPPIARPPLCEYCGYNLTAASADGRCPECGRPVNMSLGEKARPDAPWARRDVLGRWRTWWRTAQIALFRPGGLAQQIRVSSSPSHHRRFLALAIATVFLLGYFAAVAYEVADSGRNPLDSPLKLLWPPGVMFGFIGVAVSLPGVIGSVWIVSLYYRVGDRRNQLGPVMRVASYAGGFLIVWVFCSWLIPRLIEPTPVFGRLGQILGIDRGLVELMAWLSMHAMFMIAYLSLVWRMAVGVRFANR